MLKSTKLMGIGVILGIILVSIVLILAPLNHTITPATVVSSPYIGVVPNGYVHWAQPDIKVAWKGEYTDADESYIQECLFELEQNTGERFIVVDPLKGKPDILLTFATPDNMGFTWESNWAGLTSEGWYQTGNISPCVMVYISTVSSLNPNERENCIKHELAHAMGTGHIDSTNSVLNPSILGNYEFTVEDVTLLHKIYNY